MEEVSAPSHRAEVHNDALSRVHPEIDTGGRTDPSSLKILGSSVPDLNIYDCQPLSHVSNSAIASYGKSPISLNEVLPTHVQR